MPKKRADITDKQIEKAARLLCVSQGVDPDDMQWGGVGDSWSAAPAWIWHKDAIVKHHKMQMAIEEALK